MRYEDFEFLYNYEEKFWWFAGMREVTGAILDRGLHARALRVLDAGCGAGYNMAFYAASGHDLFGFDVAPETSEWIRKRGVSTFAQASMAAIPFADASFDLVVSFDSLSHVPPESYAASLAELFRVTRPGGHIFIRVAAFAWLHSSHDEEIKTLHRFTRRELNNAVASAGFRVVRSTYANALLFPIAAVHRFLKRMGIGGGTDTKPLAPGLSWMDPILRSILKSEAWLIRRGGTLPFGLSTICYARKGASQV